MLTADCVGEKKEENKAKFKIRWRETDTSGLENIHYSELRTGF
jgi:hypothetical protein